MKALKKLVTVVFILLTVSVFSGCDLYTYSTSAVQSNYDNPQWAPPYYPGARYYYLPDIETYYDLSSREFIFLNNGQWIYSPDLPPYYGNFDLNNCFAVILDVNVYQPWMHQQYYVSHYPRYYYRDYYDHSNIPYVRGFNENSRNAIYWSENERNRARKWDNEGLKQNRQFKYTKQDRDHQNSWNNNDDNTRYNNAASGYQNKQNNKNNTNANNRAGNDNSVRQSQNETYNTSRQAATDNTVRQPRNENNVSRQPTTDNAVRQASTDNNGSRRPTTDNANRQPAGSVRSAQSTNYYGRTIGQPVKVEKQMRQQTTRSTENRGGNGHDNQERR